MAGVAAFVPGPPPPSPTYSDHLACPLQPQVGRPQRGAILGLTSQSHLSRKIFQRVGLSVDLIAPLSFGGGRRFVEI